MDLSTIISILVGSGCSIVLFLMGFIMVGFRSEIKKCVKKDTCESNHKAINTVFTSYEKAAEKSEKANTYQHEELKKQSTKNFNLTSKVKDCLFQIKFDLLKSANKQNEKFNKEQKNKSGEESL